MASLLDAQHYSCIQLLVVWVLWLIAPESVRVVDGQLLIPCGLLAPQISVHLVLKRKTKKETSCCTRLDDDL